MARKLPRMEAVSKTVSYEKTERKGFLRKLGAIVTKTLSAVAGVVGGATLGSIAGTGLMTIPTAVLGGTLVFSGGIPVALAAIGAGLGLIPGMKVGDSINKVLFPEQTTATHIDYERPYVEV